MAFYPNEQIVEDMEKCIDMEAVEKLLNAFDDMILFDLFNVDCDPSLPQSETRVRWIDDDEYAINIIKCPLLIKKKIKRQKSQAKTIQKRLNNFLQDNIFFDDNTKPGVSTAHAGSDEKLKDLEKYYSAETNKPEAERESPFEW